MPQCDIAPEETGSGQPAVDVFLGGACGSTTWRRDVAIPYLKREGLTYWNPQARASARIEYLLLYPRLFMDHGRMRAGTFRPSMHVRVVLGAQTDDWHPGLIAQEDAAKVCSQAQRPMRHATLSCPRDPLWRSAPDR